MKQLKRLALLAFILKPSFAFSLSRFSRCLSGPKLDSEINQNRLKIGKSKGVTLLRIPHSI